MSGRTYEPVYSGIAQAVVDWRQITLEIALMVARSRPVLRVPKLAKED